MEQITFRFLEHLYEHNLRVRKTDIPADLVNEIHGISMKLGWAVVDGDYCQLTAEGARVLISLGMVRQLSADLQSLKQDHTYYRKEEAGRFRALDDKISGVTSFVNLRDQSLQRQSELDKQELFRHDRNMQLIAGALGLLSGVAGSLLINLLFPS